MNDLALQDQEPLDLVVADNLGRRADRIRGLVDVARGCIVEIGWELTAAKQEAGHGHWLTWLRQEFGWTAETARKYMMVGEAFQIPTKLRFDGLTIDASALYFLAAPSVPDEIRQEVIERAEAGETITLAAAEQIVADRVAAILQARQAAAAKETQALVAEIERLRGDADPDPELDPPAPSIADAVELVRQITGKKRLSARQMQALALAIGVPISDGVKIYPPTTEAASARAEARVQAMAALIRALEYFGSAPPAAEIVKAAPPCALAEATRAREAADAQDGPRMPAHGVGVYPGVSATPG